MRKCWLIAILLLVVGCSKDIDFEPSQDQAQNRILSGIIADEKDEDNESRVYLDNKIRIRWNKGDLISVFDGTTRNKEFAFLGSDGSSAGDFEDNSAGTIGTGKAIDRIYGLYPYASNTEYCYGEDESEADYLRYTLPATQTYKPNSMGLNANIMVAATANKSDKNLVFRNVCSYLRLKLYGADQTVSSIVFKGNTDEVLTGDVAITATYGNAPTIKMLGAADEDNKTITLDCSEGVAIGSTSDEATEFWLVVPPVNFPNGFTITVKGEGNMGQEIVVNNNLTFARNTYNTITREVAMTEVSDPSTEIPDNEIWYTATEKVTPYHKYVFGANIVSNTYENGKGVIKFDGPVTSIGETAFTYNSSLTSITIPNSVTSIGWSAFEDCSSLTEITIPNGVTSIGDCAFRSCISLTEITIPDSVAEIGEGAFVYCSSLTNVSIGNSVTSIGLSAFIGCSSLQKFYGKFAEDNGRCLVNDGVLIAYAEASGTEYTIPNSVTSIGEKAFYYCESLTNVSIGNSVKSIGIHAFSNCSSLTNVSIGNSVTSIGWGAFSSCSSLTNVSIGNSVTSIGEQAFRYCSSLTEITIPNSVTSIGRETFYNCSSLTEVTIGNSVTSIGEDAFYNCSSLTEITLPNSVTSIGNYAFSDCSSLTSISIPNSVTSIGNGAFYKCSSLTSITIPNSVTSIGYGAFRDCVSLIEVYCKPTTPPAGGYKMFYNNAPGRKIYVPAGSGEAYKTAEYWSEYASIIEEMGSETPPDNEIWYTASDGEVVEPDDDATVFGANIVSNTYENGKGVIKFDGAVTSIGENAFYKCSSLTSITIPNSVTSIGNYAFDGCSSLTEITVPNGVTNIGRSAFNGCGLTSFIFPKSLKTIGDNALGNCPIEILVCNTDNEFTIIPDDDYSFYTWRGLGNSSTILSKIEGKFASADNKFLIVGNQIYAFAGKDSSSSSITIDNKYIYSYVFRYCELQSLTLNNCVVYCDAYYGAKLGTLRLSDTFVDSRAAQYGRIENIYIDKECMIFDEAFYSVSCNSMYVDTPWIGGDYSDDYWPPFYYLDCDKVTFGINVERIGKSAFNYSIDVVYCESTTPPTLEDYGLGGTPEHIYVPMTSVNTYKSASGWKSFASIIEGYTE